MKLDDLHEHLRISSKLVLATELNVKLLVYTAQGSSEVAYLSSLFVSDCSTVKIYSHLFHHYEFSAHVKGNGGYLFLWNYNSHAKDDRNCSSANLQDYKCLIFVL